MLGALYSCLVHLIIVNALILGYGLYRGQLKPKKVLLFNITYLGYFLITYLPFQFEDLKQIIPGKWNWEGKSLSILFLLFVILCFKNKSSFYIPDNFRIQKKYLYLVLAVAVFENLILGAFIGFSNFDQNTFWFQLFIPSISEELLYRGILLGLLSNFIFKDLDSDWFTIGLTALLFGLGHSVFLDSDLVFSFDSGALFNTSLLGMFWAWLTLRSKSLFYGMFSHSLSNIGLAFM